MDTLIEVIIVAMSVAFTAELAELALGWIPWVGRFIKTVLTFPISLLYHYILGTEFPELVVVASASAFLSLTLGIIVDKLSTTYTQVRRGRRDY